MNDAKKNRTETWLTVIAVAVGLPLVGVVAFVMFQVNRAPLHSDPKTVASVMGVAPSPAWVDAAERGRQTARTGVAEQDLPGLSVAVGVDGQIVWSEGFGWANLESQAAVTPAMRFRIGHVSKALTSAGVGLLREQGRLHLDEEIQVYVPAYPKKEWPVTVRQLMGHVAGVRHYRDDEWGDKPSTHCERASEGVAGFANDDLLFAPETRYSYSTYGWVLVSAAVEAVAKEPFSTFMHTQVFTPVGMADTEIDNVTEPMRARVTSYYRGNLGTELTTDVDYSCFAGGGAFLSTPSDLVRFGMAMMNGTLLQPATTQLLQTRQLLRSGEETQYGLGWMLETVELAGASTQVAGHASRTIEGASTSFLTFPERGLVVAVTANMSFADPKSIALGVAEAFAAAQKGRAK
jgi:CubicO group peptidase (beta-lactamase class C family)